MTLLDRSESIEGRGQPWVTGHLLIVRTFAFKLQVFSERQRTVDVLPALTAPSESRLVRVRVTGECQLLEYRGN